MLVAFWIVSFSLVITPGADWAFAISSGLRNRALFPAVTGMLIGYLAITVVVAAGVGVLVTSAPVVLVVLTYLGAAYLLWLGIHVLRDPPVPATDNERSSGSYSTTLLRGFGISGMNPKALLLFLALVPQFTNQSATWPIAIQIGVMGIAHIINCGVVYSLVGIGSKIVLRTRPSAARRVSQFSGIIMIVIALLLIGEQSFAHFQ
ncbi:LysE family translocator [Yersinia vastinensis]|nr:LysE family translocator [Yersinia vastinensis]OVZ96233.1 LysE family translocator [Yersinia frederiksenii]RXA98050.1 LysE family translocator [Yersinia sp. 2105 StPb PI]CNH97766.1 putative LysE type translocator [Yersinia frederiksenii]CNI04672.1 putative LysE type translocator [Yersinia frederiksenii]